MSKIEEVAMAAAELLEAMAKQSPPPPVLLWHKGPQIAKALRAALDEAEKAERGIAPLLNVLRLEARYAEWRDKEIHPVNGPAFQAWILEIQLPVPLDEPDKSPEAALNRWLASVGVERRSNDEQ